MFFNINKVGDWLGSRLAKQAADLTNEDLQDMTKDQLITAVKELQAVTKKQETQLKRKSDQIFNMFVRMKF